jgi:ribosome-binding factor A
VRHALVRILGRGGLHDPALSEARVTVTEVRMSPDLRNATVFVLPFGADRDAGDLAAALRHAAPFLRGQLAGEVALRVVPSLRFEADRSFERAGRIEALLHDPQVARDIEASQEDDKDREDGDGA